VCVISVHIFVIIQLTDVLLYQNKIKVCDLKVYGNGSVVCHLYKDSVIYLYCAFRDIKYSSSPSE